MENQRLAVLRSMLDQDPANSFARYGLAMEYVKGDALETAVEEFTTLLSANPDYVAAYFHGGQSLEKLGRREAAAALYQRGLSACSRTGDAHSAAEIQAALDLLS